MAHRADDEGTGGAVAPGEACAAVTLGQLAPYLPHDVRAGLWVAADGPRPGHVVTETETLIVLDFTDGSRLTLVWEGDEAWHPVTMLPVRGRCRTQRAQRQERRSGEQQRRGPGADRGSGEPAFLYDVVVDDGLVPAQA